MNNVIKNKFDISTFVYVRTEQAILKDLVMRVKARRKELKISQKDLASQTGISYGSIKRFEQTGEISFVSLLRIARVLNSLDEFDELFKHKQILNLKDYKI